MNVILSSRIVNPFAHGSAKGPVDGIPEFWGSFKGKKNYLFENESAQEWEAQKERERVSQTDSMLNVELHMGFDLMTMRS